MYYLCIVPTAERCASTYLYFREPNPCHMQLSRSHLPSTETRRGGGNQSCVELMTLKMESKRLWGIIHRDTVPGPKTGVKDLSTAL